MITLIVGIVGVVVGFVISYAFFRNNPNLKNKADKIADAIK